MLNEATLPAVVRAALEAGIGPAGSVAAAQRVLDGTGDKAPDGVGYVIFYSTPGVVSPNRYAATHTRLVWAFYVIAVGYSPDQCRGMTRRVRDALTGARLHPRLAPVRETQAGPMLPDGPDGDRRYSQTIHYSLWTERTKA